MNWATEDIYLQTCNYGDALAAPLEAPEVEGMTFKGWDALANGAATVTGNMTVNAVYDPDVFTVVFTDGAGNAVSTQEVQFGNAAELPETNPTMTGKVFMGWNTSTDAPWWNVKSDMTVDPIFAYEETANSPIVDVPEVDKFVGPEGEKVYLSTSTDDAQIYYTIDGSEPSAPAESAESSEGKENVNTSVLYNADEGITITEPVTLRALAVKEGMNDSCESSADIDITATNDIEYAQCVVADAYYAGEPVEPGVGVWFGDTVLEPDVDYRVSYVGNEGVGTATARVEGIGDYTGYQIIEFDITEFDESMYDDYALDLSKATVSSVGTQTYSGKAITPLPVVKFEGEALTKDADYSLAYKNNVNAGTATITVKGINGYSGSVNVTFKINPAPNPLSVAGKTAKVKYNKKKASTVKASKAYSFKKTGVGEVVYSRVAKKSSKYLTVNSKNGNITVKAGAPKGKTQTINVKVTATGNANYQATAKTVAVKVKVK